MKRKKEKELLGGFPGGPVVLPVGGTTSNPDRESKIPSATRHDQKKKKKRTLE